MPTNLNVAITKSGNTFVITVSGEVDVSNCDTVVAAVQLALDHGPCEALILDLDRVSFLDCAGLSALLRINQICSEHSTRFTITHPPAVVLCPARLAGLDRTLPFESSGATDAPG